ncbi:MAG TPA: bpX6 domain-containing protein [Steroidobacter sp.]|uniref:bpX6 domain-containing protein n=1 Tax=Steroidobacter sp. TaxID=1978227 RepID=UPI002EDA9A57
MQAPDTSTVRVQQPTLRGWQSVAAVWFPADWFDPTTQARRIVSCWRPGARAMRFPRGDLLCYATAIDMDCHWLPGWPLRQQGRVLCSAALTDQERAAAPDGDVLIVLGAEVLALHTRDAVPLDPAAWLDIGRLTLHETYDCTTPPPTPIVLDLEARPLREVLGDAVPPASAEQAKFIDALRKAKRPEQGKRSSRMTRTGETSGSDGFSFSFIIKCTLVIVVLGNLSRAAPDMLPLLLVVAILAAIVLPLLGARRIVPVIVSKIVESATQDQMPARRSKQTQPQRWRQVLARWLMASQLGRLVGRAQARYMRRMLGLFEDGKLDEALRHAIPLGGESLGQAFGTPQARQDLTLSSGGGPTATLNLGDALEQHLRTLYRKAFDKLDREGRIDEAVFVLAELLNAKQEALDYLEKHQRLEQAAELALGWDMPSDVIVRLYCLADNWQRAIAVARRDKAFAGAVLQLEKKAPAAARRLRIEWGAMLTQQGDWLGAVEAVWPDASLRSEATEWLLTAEAAGGRLAARALLQRAVLLPDTLDKYSDYLQDLRSDPLLWADRANLAEALLAMERGDVPPEFAAIVAPMVIVDHAHGHRRFDRNALQQLVSLSGDRLLEADLPTRDWPVLQRTPLAKHGDVVELEGPATTGAHPILDAVPLHDQRYLIALGEAGAFVIDGSGRTRAQFAIPAQCLVVSQSRQMALALARRESLWRVSRIDLAQRNIVDLGLGELDRFGNYFDGVNWSIARGNRLQVLDTQQSLREVVWQVADLPGPVVALTSAMHLEHALVMLKDKGMEQWIYQLPQRRLLSRDLVPDAEGKMRLLNSTRGIVEVAMEPLASDELVLHVEWNRFGGKFDYRLRTLPEAPLALWTDADWLVISFPAADGYEVHWILLTSGELRARVRWPGQIAPAIRAVGHEWVLFDRSGRLMSLNVEDGQHHNVTLR